MLLYNHFIVDFPQSVLVKEFLKCDENWQSYRWVRCPTFWNTLYNIFYCISVINSLSYLQSPIGA